MSAQVESEQPQETDRPSTRIPEDSTNAEAANSSTSSSQLARNESLQSSTLDNARIPTTMSQTDKPMIRDKMRDTFAKLITDIDTHVLDVGQSQCELDSQLDQLVATLDSIKVDEQLTAEISENAKRISSLKSRLTVIHTILSDSGARCSRTLAACSAAVQATPTSLTSIPSSPGAMNVNNPVPATTSHQ